jgi:hypothetical protein
LLAALMSAGLMVIYGVAAGSTAQAATSGAESASAPCVVSINAPRCQSTNANLTVDVVNTGDTSACTFTYSIAWGDGSAAQRVTVNGESQSGEYFLASHTYHTTQTHTYSIATSPVSITGSCNSEAGSYTFTLDVGSTALAAPSNLTVTAMDAHDIRVSWHDNSQNETGFEINNGVTSKNVAANSTTYTWGGLAPGTYMCFHVRAHNSAGSSAWDPNVSPWYVCATTPKAGSVTTTPATVWAAYSASPVNGYVTDVFATWTVPAVNCPSLLSQPRTSVWAGIWGSFSSMANNTGWLPQIGTTADCNFVPGPGNFPVTAPGAHYRVVWEMQSQVTNGGNRVQYGMDCPGNKLYRLCGNLTAVSAHDKIQAAVRFTGPYTSKATQRTFVIVISDLTKKTSALGFIKTNKPVMMSDIAGQGGAVVEENGTQGLASFSTPVNLSKVHVQGGSGGYLFYKWPMTSYNVGYGVPQLQQSSYSSRDAKYSYSVTWKQS